MTTLGHMQVSPILPAHTRGFMKVTERADDPAGMPDVSGHDWKGTVISMVYS